MAQRIRKSAAQQIVETVKDVSGFDVNFIDRDGIIFASTDPGRVGDFHEIGLRVVKTGEAIEVSGGEGYLGTQNGVNLPFSYRGEVIAAVGITGEPERVRKYAHLAQRITALILREQELDERSGSEKARTNYLIRALTLGEPVNMDFLRKNIEKYGLAPGSLCRTVIVRRRPGEEQINESRLANAAEEAFRRMGAGFWSFIFPGDYVLIARADQAERGLPVLRQLAADCGGAVRIGVGNADALTRQDRSYGAASIALRSLSGERRFALFDELDLDILLGSVPESAAGRFLERVSTGLSEGDRELLEAYFEGNMSLKTVSEKLFLHKNTIQYRLDRVARETGRNPRVFTDAVILYLALKLMEK